MAKKFDELRKKMRPERRRRNAQEAAKMALTLNDLRAARGIVQTALAEELGVSQASVSKMLSRDDMRVSSLRALIEAMGGTLEIRARFDGEEIQLRLADAEAQQPIA